MKYLILIILFSIVSTDLVFKAGLYSAFIGLFAFAISKAEPSNRQQNQAIDIRD